MVKSQAIGFQVFKCIVDERAIFRLEAVDDVARQIASHPFNLRQGVVHLADIAAIDEAIGVIPRDEQVDHRVRNDRQSVARTTVGKLFFAEVLIRELDLMLQLIAGRVKLFVDNMFLLAAILREFFDPRPILSDPNACILKLFAILSDTDLRQFRINQDNKRVMRADGGLEVLRGRMVDIFAHGVAKIHKTAGDLRGGVERLTVMSKFCEIVVERANGLDRAQAQDQKNRRNGGE